MKTLLASIFVILCATGFSAMAAPPSGTTWYLYWVDKDSSESYVSMKYYNVRDSRARVLTYIDRPNIGQHTTVVELFDCPTRRVARLTMADYDASDVLIKRYEKDNEIPEFKSLYPPEIDRVNTLFNGICLGQVGGMPASATVAAKYFEEFDAEVRKIRRH
jgi:hypothetical protein